MASVKLLKKMASATTPQMVAAEAVYVALGYAMSGYIKVLKGLEKTYAQELLMTSELYEFNIAHMIAEIKPKRVLLNEKYKLDKKVTSGDIVKPEALGTTSTRDVTPALAAIRGAAEAAITEMMDSLVHYKTTEDVEYSILIKTVQKNCIAATVTYFRKLAKKADDMLLERLVSVPETA
jgi:hypothetical protein